MAIRQRTSKSVARRHDLLYFRKGSPIRLWQWRIAAIALLTAIAWIAFSASHSASAFSAGPISAPHAVFGQKCEVCHKPLVPGAGWLPIIGARRKVPDSACLACHQVGTHHVDATVANKPCSSCHLEHIGATHLAATPVQGCTQCHAKLQLSGRYPSLIATGIISFTNGHPDFRHRPNLDIKFDHAAHLAKNLTGPSGTRTTLTCANCHGTPTTGRMTPVDFDRSCRSCHSLEFSTRVPEQAPHGDVRTVLRFVQEKMVAAAPRDEAALINAETIIFREKCALCHTVENATTLPRALIAGPDLPSIRLPEFNFPRSNFSHSAHSAVQCAECHTAALTSSTLHDNLLPGIATCQRCHDGLSNPQGALPAGHAESGCALCHTYHEGGRIHGDATTPAFRIDELTPSR